MLAESDEASNYIVDKNVADVLAKHGDVLLDLHFTDQKVYSKQVPMNQLFMRARLQITENDEQLAKTIKVLKVLFYMVDRVSSIKLSQDSRLKCKRTRELHATVVKDEAYEENEKKKDEKARKEYQEYMKKLKSLPPDQQRKLEEKKIEIL